MMDTEQTTPLSGEAVFEMILERFARNGDRHYGENVTELEHALQTAAAAEFMKAGDDVIVACLLHDYGHLLHDLGEDIADHGVDARHEDLGAEVLRNYFPDEIVEPVRMHVDAKRYLCAVDEIYAAGLSAASKLSLELQGGPMSPSEVAEFEQHPHFQAAILLRRCDDAGKVPGSPTRQLEEYREKVIKFVLQ